MGYSQNNPLPRMKSALRMEKDMRKSGIHRNSALHNAEQYGIKGNDELDYMPIEDDMHRKGDSPASRRGHGQSKGDQSATRKDYADFKDTDPGYHGHDGESHGDQSATRADYTK